MRHISAAHRFGDQVVPADIQQDIVTAIRNATTIPARRSSPHIKDEILESLQGAGWSAEVELDPVSRITITSCKKKVGLVFQTGNMGRMYADLLKLQTLYLRETIMAGVFIVPTYDAAQLLGDNITNFDRLKKELPIFERAITVPILIYGFE
jgi:hypothetical protein